MKLSTWLKDQRLTHQEFRELCMLAGSTVSIHAIHKWCSHERMPRRPEMQTIHKITEGAVTADDFYALDPLY